jgi:hypothetical protein
MTDGQIAQLIGAAIEEDRSAYAAILDQIENHAGEIFVPECFDGQWKTVALSELPAPLAIQHVIRFLREMRMPLAESSAS